MIIAIDGPAGSGKSTVAKKLAEKLDFYYLYTGLLYRAVAYIWINKLKRSLNNIKNISNEDLQFISKISYEYKNDEPRVIYNGENLTSHLFNTSLSQSASIISAQKIIRKALLDTQRNVAKKYNIVVEGRDCGSVIFPYADYKFFLTASLEVRARRIFEDKKRANKDLSFDEVKAALEERDERDTNRDVAPLIIPKDAIIIDNSKFTEKQTLEIFLSFIKTRKTAKLVENK